MRKAKKATRKKAACQEEGCSEEKGRCQEEGCTEEEGRQESDKEDSLRGED